ncbi:helix-turn-helix domain-containing protein [Rummeliibacillus sp. TYF005]|uniref:helix-turn-helix domain-containing protein n=1 Tax=Rummeliibacillus sp. TYF005 TaxID=2058214 RepID=UPI000F522669|nr:helix-turn-helix domain-containing protein [Rummeliibacillus sp. TYF005]RPJ93973.1 hypothetical protein CW357_17850 [Rummeliibacillus sp. TYF005]
MIRLTIEQAALKRNIKTQTELKNRVLKKTGIELRAASISDMYRNNKMQINRDHLDAIMQGLDITDFNEVLTIIPDGSKDSK